MSPSVSRLIARGYHTQSMQQSYWTHSESVLDGSANQGETELNLDALPVLPAKEKKGQASRHFNRSKLIEMDEKELDLDDIPSKPNRGVIESSDEEEPTGNRQGRNIVIEDDSESDEKKSSKPTAVEPERHLQLLYDSKSEQERRDYIETNLRSLEQRSSRELVIKLIQSFL